MAKIVFTLTTAQVKALVQVSARRAAAYGDYGATRGLVARKLVETFNRHNLTGYKLTAAGRHAFALIRILKLHKLPPEPPQVTP